MSQAGQNLKYLRKQKGWTQEELAEQLGIKRSLVGAYEEERAEPRLDITQLICDMFKLSLEDFLFKDLSGSRMSYLQKRRAAKLGEDKKSIIQLVPIKAAAGYLTGYSDPGFIDELNTFTLPMLTPGDYRAFEITGDSMLPTPGGSIIVGEKVPDINEVKVNDTYIVINKYDGVVYKRIERNGRNKKQITLISDNPAFAPYTMNTEDVLELWKTRFIISKPSERPDFDVNHLANVVNTLQTHVSNLKKRMN